MMQPHHWYTAFMLLALAVFLVARHFTPRRRNWPRCRADIGWPWR